MVVVHAEATKHLHRCVQYIKNKGMQAGVAFNPASPLCLVEEILPDVDIVLLMSVNPGFGGQSFIETTVPKIARLRKMIDDAGLNIEIQVPPLLAAYTGIRLQTPSTAPASNVAKILLLKSFSFPAIFIAPHNFSLVFAVPCSTCHPVSQAYLNKFQ